VTVVLVWLLLWSLPSGADCLLYFARVLLWHSISLINQG